MIRGLLVLVLSVLAVQAQHQQEQGPPPHEGQAPPEINWGKCPQLRPTDEEARQKGAVIETCLQQNPPPPLNRRPTREQIEEHNEKVTNCALSAEGWFNDDGTYKFERAKTEIQKKNLDPEITESALAKHDSCQAEAREKFANSNTHQVRLYQACMDYNIAQICGIELPHGPAK